MRLPGPLVFVTVATFFSCLCFAQDDLLDIILEKLAAAVDCNSCQALLDPLQTLAHMGDDAFSSTFVTICKDLKLDDDDVCEGTFELLGPLLAHSLRQFTIGGTTSLKFCMAAFDLCDQPFTPFQVPFPKPHPVNPRTFVSKGRKPFQVVHLSDVHIDRQYTVGADANCTKNICCRNYADHTGPILQPAQPFGNSKCDSPGDLASSLIDAFPGAAPHAKFALFTGDVIEGATWLVDKKEGLVDLAAWNNQMASKARLPIYGAIGNHDSSPVNGFPRNDTVTKLNAQWVFDTQAEGWKRWIHASGADQLRHTSGSYSAVVPGTSLRLISINTQFWYPQNFWLYDTDNMPPDPNGILEFMVDQLQEAEDAGQRAYLFGHIPSGKQDIFHDQSNYYDQIIQRYKATIAGQFFGHSHKDQFEIAYSDWNNQTAETADNIAFVGPALTPTSGNPAFKVYDVDPDTYEVLDMKVYMTNVSDSFFQINPKWQLYYSAKESYGAMVGGLQPTDALNASFWHKVTEVFEANDTAFQLFNTRLSRGGAVSPCTGDCKQATICDMRAARSQNNCDSPTSSPFKREEKREQIHDECEGNMLRPIFAELISGRSLSLSESSKAMIRRSINQERA